jgi:hypothetical protein
MSQMIKHRTWMTTQTPQQRAATERMALFPDKAEVLFVAEDIWVVSYVLAQHFWTCVDIV